MSHHRSFKWIVALVVLMLLLSQGVVLGQGQPAAPVTAPASPAEVITWNEIAQRAAITVAKQFQAQSEIYVSFAQAAVYDAVVAIEGRYQSYKLILTRHPDASVAAAVAAAAHDALAHYFP